MKDSNKFLISLSAHSSSNADIRPPSHIPSVCLEDIGMTFHFSSCRRIRHASKAQLALSGSGVHHIWATTNPVDEHLDRPCYSPISSPAGAQGVSDTRMDGCAPWILVASSVGTSPASSQGSVLSNTYSTSSQDAQTTGHRYAIQDVKLETLVRLVDSTLRRMMSDYKPVRQGGIILSSDAGFAKLAIISPALFSPGYVKVPPIIEFHDSTDGLIPGDFGAFWATSHNCTHCVLRVSPYKFQPLEK